MEVEWRDVLLADLAAPIRNALVGGPFGSDLVSADYSPAGVPVIRGENLSSGRWVAGPFAFVPTRKAAQLSANTAGPLDIVFTQRGANHYRQVALVPADAKQRFVISQSQMKLTVDPDHVDPLFVYYLFRAPCQQEYLQRHAIQTGVPHTNLSILRGVPLRVPPRHIQRAIARVLGTLDDKIELNGRMADTLEAMARALFKSWFVDFDPVRAKAEGRDPGLPKAFADLFPARFVDSELGEIPEGWWVGSIYEIADVVYGAPFASAHFNAKGLGQPLIRIRDLTNESPGVWTPEVHPKGYKVQPGDIVVGMDGEFRAYLWGGAEAWLNQRVCAFVPKGGASAAFVRNSILKPLARVEATETATTVIHLGKGDIDCFRLVVPGAKPLAVFNEHCQPWYERIVAGKQESLSLASLRDALLPKLVSGELRVGEAASLVEATA